VERERLRETFEEVPELYDRARPVYPEEVFDDIVDLARLRHSARLLEIGCGTGLATRGFAERGHFVVCVELGAGLAAVARRKLERFPNVEVVDANFDTWEPGDGGFDAVVAFTAFHWVDPTLRYEKSARLVRPRGALAVVATQHVLPACGDSFWAEVQEDYDAIVPRAANEPPPLPAEVEDLRAEIQASGRFENVGARRYLRDVQYTADEYIDVLDTYSGHRTIDARKRDRLYALIRRRIEARPDGRVTKTYLFTLNVARRI
jgi:SAM-dependent methyltransferase